jgi:hypothetical protein
LETRVKRAFVLLKHPFVHHFLEAFCVTTLNLSAASFKIKTEKSVRIVWAISFNVILEFLNCREVKVTLLRHQTREHFFLLFVCQSALVALQELLNGDEFTFKV